MRLSSVNFNNHLAHMGQDVSWSKADICPCKDEYSGAAKTDCNACNGMGYIWSSAKKGVIGVSGQKLQRQWQQFGIFEEGDLVVTIPSDSIIYNIGPYDRIVQSNSETPFSITILHDGNDKLRFKSSSITRVFWLDDLGAIVEGGIPDIDTLGNLTWSSGEPPADTRYTLTGKKHPEYYFFRDMFQDRPHHQGELLPRRVVLRGFDLLSRTS